MKHSVVIVGGGLAGLTAARALYEHGVDVQLVEARNRLGGRILSVDVAGEPSLDGFDLGPSWFWPELHPAMAGFVAELGISFFPQHSDGDIVFQGGRGEAPQRYGSAAQQPRSMRLEGGSGAIIRALAARLPADRIRLGESVVRARLAADAVELGLRNDHGTATSILASQVIFAVPPRLLAAGSSFSPPLTAATLQRWRNTPTWMAPHAKFLAVYRTPFWRVGGLSGTAQSMAGPLVEIHDATTASGQAALFGFLGIPMAVRMRHGRDLIVDACIKQLCEVFGPEAANPVATLFKDWATDPLTATIDDAVAGEHPAPDSRSWNVEGWEQHVSLAASETSASAPGYLAGAIEAGTRAAQDVMTRLGRPAAR